MQKTFNNRTVGLPNKKTLVASSELLKSDKLRPGGDRLDISSNEWQEEALDLNNVVGELHYLTGTVANRAGQATLYVGKVPDSPSDSPEPVEDESISSVLDIISNIRDVIRRSTLNLQLTGECFLIGIKEVSDNVDPNNVPLDSYHWDIYSIDEVFTDISGVKVSNQYGKLSTYSFDDVFIVRIWNPNARYRWQADSAVRSAIPVLREIVGLTMHTTAQVDSRLAGAGILLMPSEARSQLDQDLRAQGHGDRGADPLMEALIEALVTPISHRDSAGAVVPYVLSMGGEYLDKVKHITFSTPLDENAATLLDQAIRRLALSLDCPPELLLGVGGMNHWGAWLVQEDVVTTHLEPPLRLICEALTKQLLHPILESNGVSDYLDYVIHYDISSLIIRPNRGADSIKLHQLGVISDESVRQSNGFDDSDSPTTTSDPVVETVLELISNAPSLATSVGIAELTRQVRELYSGDFADSSDTSVNSGTEDDITDDITGEIGTPDMSESMDSGE